MERLRKFLGKTEQSSSGDYTRQQRQRADASTSVDSGNQQEISEQDMLDKYSKECKIRLQERQLNYKEIQKMEKILENRKKTGKWNNIHGWHPYLMEWLKEDFDEFKQGSKDQGSRS